MKVILIIGGVALILVVVLVLLFSRWIKRLGPPVNATLSDSYYYHARKKVIVYSPMGNWFELGYRELEADLPSFTVLGRDYGKDMTSVFYEGFKQPVDVTSFYLDAQSIPKDKNHAYHPTRHLHTLKVVEGADPATYHRCTGGQYDHDLGWFRDATNFFLDGQRLEVDAESFQLLNRTLALDVHQIYIVVTPFNRPREVKPVQANPGGHYAAINDYYAQVGELLFFSFGDTLHTVTIGAVDSIRAVEDATVIADKMVVTHGIPVPQAEASTLQVVSFNYLKDRHHVFYRGRQLPGAEAATFEVLRLGYSRDKHRVFYEADLIPDANPATVSFDQVSETMTDGKRVYRNGQPVQPSR